MTTLLWIGRIVLVMALVCVAAVLATPKGRLPLAVRGLARILRRDRGIATSAAEPAQTPSAGRRSLAFLLVLLAFLIAVL